MKNYKPLFQLLLLMFGLSLLLSSCSNTISDSNSQTNRKDPAENIVWSTGSETYEGNIAKQYAIGCYAEVWFKEATVGSVTVPNKQYI